MKCKPFLEVSKWEPFRCGNHIRTKETCSTMPALDFPAVTSNIHKEVTQQIGQRGFCMVKSQQHDSQPFQTSSAVLSTPATPATAGASTCSSPRDPLCLDWSDHQQLFKRVDESMEKLKTAGGVHTSVHTQWQWSQYMQHWWCQR